MQDDFKTSFKLALDHSLSPATWQRLENAECSIGYCEELFRIIHYYTVMEDSPGLQASLQALANALGTSTGTIKRVKAKLRRKGLIKRINYKDHNEKDVAIWFAVLDEDVPTEDILNEDNLKYDLPKLIDNNRVLSDDWVRLIHSNCFQYLGLYTILNYCYQKNKTIHTLSQLAKLLKTTPNDIVRALNVLYEEGLLEREYCRSDGSSSNCANARYSPEYVVVHIY